MKQRLDEMTERRGQAANLSELERRVKIVYNRTTPKYVPSLYASMPGRCAAMVSGEGRHCRYKSS